MEKLKLNFKEFIDEIPDFPKEGISFKDISPLLMNPSAFDSALEEMVNPFKMEGVTSVVGIEARGFILGPSIAFKLNSPFIPIRKPGKLPGKIVQESYELEYGQDTLEIQADKIKNGDRVLIVDDVLATGGTVTAAKKLVENQGAEVAGYSFLIELGFLEGRTKIGPEKVFSLTNF